VVGGVAEAEGIACERNSLCFFRTRPIPTHHSKKKEKQKTLHHSKYALVLVAITDNMSLSEGI
jgi:hypothetical protein